MGMDLRFYTSPNSKSTTIEFTQVAETRDNELYLAIGDVIGFGLNGSFSPITSGELEMVVELLKNPGAPNKVWLLPGFPHYHRIRCVEPGRMRRLGGPSAGGMELIETAEALGFTPCPLCRPDIAQEDLGIDPENAETVQLVQHLIDHLDNGGDEEAVIWFEWDN